jgi:hypothetical protein
MKLLFSLALLASAAPLPVTPEIPEYGAGKCSAKNVQGVVSRPASKARVAWALTRSKAKIVRRLRPNQMVTQEYRTDRLNVLVDRRNIIRRIFCG